MQKQKSSYTLLINKLDQFIRKFYINQLIRGSLYTIAVVLALFLLFNLLEHNFYFDKGIRKVFFFSFLGVSLASLTYWVVLPLSKYLKIGKVISHEHAATIIGSHFSNVQDKLLNILQLKKQSYNVQDAALIEASINQKSEKISLVPFKSAIDLSKNRKYLRYALPPFLVFLALVFAAPSIIKDSSYRILNNDTDFEKPAPFHFDIDENDLTVVQYGDFPITISTEGSAIPNEAFIEIDNFQYRLQSTEAGKFTYTFRNVQKNTDFRLFSGSVSSRDYTLEVLAKPNLSNFDISLDFPSYIGRKDEVINNVGDLVIPEGTKVQWQFNTKNTDDISLYFSEDDTYHNADKKSVDYYTYKKSVRKDELYKVFISNENIPKGDSITYFISVIKDQYPSISVEKFQDSLEDNIFYFVGEASDDYGLNSLSFNFSVVDEKGDIKSSESVKVMDPASRETQYDYTFDLNTLDLAPGDKVDFYFQIYDNDGVNGRKSAKTGLMTFAKPTIEEYEKLEDENEEEIKENLEEAIKDMEKLKENFQKMREKLLEKNELDWQDKEELEKLIEAQKKLEEKLNKAKEKFEENLKNQESFKEPDEEIQEKQEKLQEMFEEALDPETQELMEKIEELLQELKKDEALDMLEQFEMNDETMEQEMERLLELYKQLEVEKEVKDQIEKLEELAERQEELSKETEQQEQKSGEELNDEENAGEKTEEEQKAEEKTEGEQKSDEELKEEQKEINEEFQDIKEKMEEIQEKNEELQRPKELGGDKEEEMEEIQQDLNESRENLEQQNKAAASKSQKSAAQKMKNMAGNLESAMESGEQEQAEEDIKALRQLLENLVTLSFDQEDLITDFSKTKITTPKYVDLVQQQFKIKNDFKLIEDSLTMLANRVENIQSFVLDKVADVKQNLSESIEQLEDRKVTQAGDHQRRTMTDVNDLALMLSESMQNMQMQMAMSMPGSQMCNKPGGQGKGKDGDQGKVPMDKITEGQQGVKEGLEGMKEKMGNGEKPSSKEFAQAAARQAALRKALEEMNEDAKEQGKGSKELQEIIDEMDKIEIDLVNKRLDNEMMLRQEDILTRLLEAEKAERQREYDNKRKAETGEDKRRELPPSLQEYIKKREAEIEMYKSVSPSLRPYYRSLVDEYYKALKSEK